MARRRIELPFGATQSRDVVKDAADDAGETGRSYGITDDRNSAVVIGMRHFTASGLPDQEACFD